MKCYNRFHTRTHLFLDDEKRKCFVAVSQYKMQQLTVIFSLLVLLAVNSECHPHLYNPYYSSSYQYINHLRPFKPVEVPHNYLHDPVLTSYVSTPNQLPTLNVLAETPYQIKSEFSVVPMLVVAKENMKMVPNNGQILSVSQKKPLMTVKSQNNLLQCTPAVKITLKTPILVYSLKSNVVFPAEINIIHGRYRIPIRVGAVIAPVSQDTYVSTESPVALSVVYAVPTRPIKLDYVNNQNVLISHDSQAVIVESQPLYPPQNVTIINFPEKQAEPILAVDEDDEELVHRQPPIVLAPAGIVQSTQPQTIHLPFTNSKESPILTALREEAIKHRY